jgi:hypothetical protein
LFDDGDGVFAVGDYVVEDHGGEGRERIDERSYVFEASFKFLPDIGGEFCGEIFDGSWDVAI